MKTFNGSFLVALAALAMAESAYAQQPPDVVASDGYGNTGMGTLALFNLTPDTSKGGYLGHQNTASGYASLWANTSGEGNTASGAYTLESNTTGAGNTASGASALSDNSIGNYNSASGWLSLLDNGTGNYNSAFGAYALELNTSGSDNTADGDYALHSNSTGNWNTAVGYAALLYNTTGTANTASGTFTFNANTTGSYNIASGFGALNNNTTGSNNIAEGFLAGYYLTTGSNNIDIGNVGLAGESNTIRIGTKGTHKVTVIAGIYATPVTGAAVVVSSTGRLGVTVSSERFKTGIAPMGANSSKLQQLRPVTFRLKSDRKGTLQYGLIAEEVAKVYPELVIRSETGRVDGVRYDELAPILLGEVQQQQSKIAAQAAQLQDVQRQLAMLQAALTKLQPKDEIVAQR
jgi:Chaperone of endosialidase